MIEPGMQKNNVKFIMYCMDVFIVASANIHVTVVC